MNSQKLILNLVVDFAEDYEVYVPISTLDTLGYIVHTASPGKKCGDIIKTAIHDFEGHQTYTEKVGHNVPINVNFDEIKVDNYAGLVIPGGRSPEFLRSNQPALLLVKEFFEKKKPVAAMCHSLMVLISAGVLKERKCTGYPVLKDDIVLSGGQFVESNSTFSNVVVDGNLVSTPAWPGLGGLMREFHNLLSI